MVGEGALHLAVHVHVVPLQLAQLESRPLAGPTLLYSISLGENGSPGADAWNESGTFCMDGMGCMDGIDGMDGMGCMDCMDCMDGIDCMDGMGCIGCMGCMGCMGRGIAEAM